MCVGHLKEHFPELSVEGCKVSQVGQVGGRKGLGEAERS